MAQIRYRSPSTKPSTWLAEATRQKRPYRRVSASSRLEAVLQSPLLATAVGLLVVALALILRVTSPVIMPALAPDDPGDALSLAWQVQTSIAGLASAGLALIIQLAGTPPIAIRSSREVLYNRALFKGLLLYVGITNLALGVVATWIGGSAGVALCFVFCLAGTLAFVGLSYTRVAAYFLDDDNARSAALHVLRDKIAGRLHELQVLAEANADLGDMFGPDSPISRYDHIPDRASTASLVVAAEDQFLDDLDPAAIKKIGAQVLGRLRASRFAVSVAPSQDLEPEAATAAGITPFIRIQHDIGQRVIAGDPVFTLVTATPINESQRRALTSAFTKAVRLRPAVISSIAEDEAITGELVTLKDSVLAAAAAGATGALSKGLNAYEELFTALLSVAGDRDSQHLGYRHRPYGPQWQWMNANIREITEAAIRSLGERGLTAAVDHTYRLCTAARTARDLGALRQFLLLYPAHLRLAITGPAPLPIGYLALKLQTLTGLSFREISADDTQLRDALRALTAETFAESFKVCVDSRNPSALRSLLPYFEAQQTFATGNPERRSESGRKASVLLAALAWTLFCITNHAPADDLAPIVEALAGVVPSHLLWQAYVEATDDGPGRPWQDWEIATKAPFTFHFMSFDSYLAVATLIMGRQGIVVPPKPTATDADRASRLIEAREFAQQCLSLAPGITPADLNTVVAQLNDLVTEAKTAQTERLREQPLQTGNIQLLVDAVPRVLASSSHRLTELLKHRNGETAGDPRTLAISALVAREYFVTSPRWHADPAELGADVAHGLITAENRFVIDSLLAEQQPSPATDDDIRAARKAFTDRTGRDPFVIVLNSWRTAQALGVQDVGTASPTGPGLSLSAADLGSQPPPPTCILCDPDQLPALVRNPQQLDDEPGWHNLPEAGVAVAVRDYTQATANPVAHLMAAVSVGWSGSVPDAAVEVYQLPAAG
ncbi:hypothetical protein ACTOB_003636 [Actinoplanes oblitus]|uniref:Uncharacterized protein n=1 Tax=Actinoplanes oblitus TaxID=3040509 RepID=A0ABY8WSX7_9ACTN|nr:hypothetical protein [Actinoplanes oblitus]WIM99965.1 hypothetical protein ACTOB_003636 [Actinoplanes oblitus]